MDFLRIGSCILCLIVVVSAAEEQSTGQNSALSAISKVYTQCETAEDLLNCFKLQAIRLAGRAIKVQNIKLIDGVSVIKRKGFRESRAFNEDLLKSKDLQTMSSKKLDDILYNVACQLMESHQLQVNVPRLMTYGQQEVTSFIEEGRKKKKKYLGPFLAAVALKAGILKMAYHSIAIVAGKALIIGKIALVISAIIGLKKLVAPEGHEKTTYEIVKHPHVQQSHSYSSSSGEFEGHEGGGGGGSGQYHRSLNDEEMLMQDRIYRAQVPRN